MNRCVSVSLSVSVSASVVSLRASHSVSIRVFDVWAMCERVRVHVAQDLGEDVSEGDADPEMPDVGQVKDKKKNKGTNSKGKYELKTLKKYSSKKMAADEEVGEESHHEQVCLSPYICMCVCEGVGGVVTCVIPFTFSAHSCI